MGEGKPESLDSFNKTLAILTFIDNLIESDKKALEFLKDRQGNIPSERMAQAEAIGRRIGSSEQIRSMLLDAYPELEIAKKK